MIAVRGKRLGGGTMNQEATNGGDNKNNNPEKTKPTPSLADLAGGKKKTDGGNPKAALQQADKLLAREKAAQDRFLQQQQQIKNASGKDKKQRRRSTMEESNKNKNGVLEWTAWKRGSDASSVGLPEAPKKEAPGPKPVNRRRYTVTLHQAWVGPASSSQPLAAKANKQRRRSTFEQSNKNQNGVLEWTAWKRNSSNGSDVVVGLPEAPKKNASSGPRNRRQTITVHHAWVGLASKSPQPTAASKQRRRSTFEQSNKNQKGVLEWTAWKRNSSNGSDVVVGLPEAPEKNASSGPRNRRQTITVHHAWVGSASMSPQPVAASKQRRRSTFEESNKNQKGVLEWTAWKRNSSSGSDQVVGLPETPKKKASGPRPVNRRQTITLHQAWVGSPAAAMKSLAPVTETKPERGRGRGRTSSRNTHEKTKPRRRRRSTLAESNKNTNGVLEWTAWKRPSDASAPGLDTEAKPMAGPRPVKRESVRSNVYHAWVDVDGAFTELPREFSAEEKDDTRQKEQEEDNNSSSTKAKEDQQSTSDEASSSSDKVKSWISRHKYHLIAAGVVTVAAIGVKLVFGGKKERSAGSA